MGVAGIPDAPIVHVALTVSELERSIDWYTGLFATGPARVGSFLTGSSDAYRAAIWAVPNLGLHCFDGGRAEPFDARRPGLDHVALQCPDRDTLLLWRDHVDSLGYARGDILDESYGSGLAVFDPDGIAIELFVSRPRTRPPAQAQP